MSFKGLFSRSLGADPGRLHFAAHSHHLWPDASFDGQVEAWNDAARLADRKWDKVMDEVWPAAQAEVAAELGTGRADAIVFAPNTHDLLVRMFAAASESWPIRVLTSDGEFHSARRQLARWEEAGAAVVDRISTEPFESFSDRFMEAAGSGLRMVITDIRGCREIGTHGEHLLLVPPRTADDLTDAVRSLLDDADLRKQLGTAAQARAVAEFDQRVVARRSLETYVRVANARGLPWQLVDR